MITVSEQKDAINLKKSKESFMGGFGGRRGRGELM